jgi:hypothetical protein
MKWSHHLTREAMMRSTFAELSPSIACCIIRICIGPGAMGGWATVHGCTSAPAALTLSLLGTPLPAPPTVPPSPLAAAAAAALPLPLTMLTLLPTEASLEARLRGRPASHVRKPRWQRGLHRLISRPHLHNEGDVALLCPKWVCGGVRATPCHVHRKFRIDGHLSYVLTCSTSTPHPPPPPRTLTADKQGANTQHPPPRTLTADKQGANTQHPPARRYNIHRRPRTGCSEIGNFFTTPTLQRGTNTATWHQHCSVAPTLQRGRATSAKGTRGAVTTKEAKRTLRFFL